MTPNRRHRLNEAALQDAEREANAALEQLRAAGLASPPRPADADIAQVRHRSFAAVAQLRRAEGSAIGHRKPRPQRGFVVGPSRTSLAWAAAIVAVAAAAAGILLPGATPAAVAAGPPPLNFSQVSISSDLSSVPSADSELLTLASLAEGGASPDASGGYDIQSSEWALAFEEDGKDPQSAVIPFNTVVSVNPDGSAQRVQRRGAPLGSDGRGAAFDADELLGPSQQVDRLPAGTIDTSLTARLPRQPDLLRVALLDERGCPEQPTSDDLPTGSYGVGCLVGSLTDLYAYHQIPPDLQAGIWRMLAEDPAFKWAGAGTDRAGRACVAVVANATAGGQTQRWVLMIDDGTGNLLGIDDVLTSGEAGGIEAPVVLNFVAYL